MPLRRPVVEKYQFRAPPGRTVTVTGEILSRVSSRSGRKQRWTDLILVRRVDGCYVVWTCGRSRAPGEVDLPRLSVAQSAREVIEILEHRGELSNLAWLLLEQAALYDDTVAQELQSYRSC